MSEYDMASMGAFNNLSKHVENLEELLSIAIEALLANTSTSGEPNESLSILKNYMVQERISHQYKMLIALQTRVVFYTKSGDSEKAEEARNLLNLVNALDVHKDLTPQLGQTVYDILHP